MHGTIQRVRADKGFGFVRAAGETTDRFFHVSGVPGGDLTALTPGTPVTFDHEDSPKGPRATNIVVVS